MKKRLRKTYYTAQHIQYVESENYQYKLADYYGGREVQNKSRFWKQNNKLQTQMQI